MSVDSSVGGIQLLVDEALVEIGGAESSRDIEQVRVGFLGKKGALTEQLKRIGSLPTQERRAFGQAVNDAKQLLAEKIAERAVQLDRKVLADMAVQDEQSFSAIADKAKAALAA